MGTSCNVPIFPFRMRYGANSSFLERPLLQIFLKKQGWKCRQFLWHNQGKNEKKNRIRKRQRRDVELPTVNGIPFTRSCRHSRFYNTSVEVPNITNHTPMRIWILKIKALPSEPGKSAGSLQQWPAGTPITIYCPVSGRGNRRERVVLLCSFIDAAPHLA